MKKEILDYKTARAEFITWIGLVPAEKRETVAVGDWSLKDIIAHLNGWAQFQNRVIQSLLFGKEPEDVINISQFNIDSVNHQKDWHWDKIYKEFLQTSEQLLSKYMLIPEKFWDKPIWPHKKTTLAKLIKIETRHYQGEHLEQIRKLARKTLSS